MLLLIVLLYRNNFKISYEILKFDIQMHIKIIIKILLIEFIN